MNNNDTHRQQDNPGVPKKHEKSKTPHRRNQKKTIALEKENWYIEYTHAGHCGNELADKLAKEAAKNSEICYNKITKSEIEHQESEKII